MAHIHIHIYTPTYLRSSHCKKKISKRDITIIIIHTYTTHYTFMDRLIFRFAFFGYRVGVTRKNDVMLKEEEKKTG